MLRTMENIRGNGVHAVDGDIGHVEEFYFDDDRWAIRYLVVDTGPWVFGRKVLISPLSVQSVEWEGKKVLLTLSKDQVRNSPDIDTQKPISRLQEAEYNRYYGLPYYWGGTGIWGNGMFPGGMPVAFIPKEAPAESDIVDAENLNTHLRSSKEVVGYRIHSLDGHIGHVDDFLFEDDSWAVRYVVVDTKNILPGKKVILAPRWITDMNWADSSMSMKLTKEQIKNAPEYDPANPVQREYEERLHDYYGWEDRYWL